MLAPLGNTISVPITQTLVSTQLPNAIALRVPSSDVSPSVSSAEIYNNASGNNVASVKTDAPQVNIAFVNGTATENLSAANTNKNFSGVTANAQTMFLAQLASGDISPEVRGLFAQYEKLISYANVKYKPSNAGKPTEPASAFRTLLQLAKEKPVEIEILPQAEPTREITIPTKPTVESISLKTVEIRTQPVQLAPSDSDLPERTPASPLPQEQPESPRTDRDDL